MNNSYQTKSLKAFSLIELSIVVLIVGIIVAGVTQSTSLVRKMRLSTAKSLTASSDIASIPNLTTWLETTKDESLIDSEEDDGDTISVWYDINPQQTLKNNAQQLSATSNLHPTYISNCIKNLPCLNFNGSTTYMNTTQDFGTVNALSLFAVVTINAHGTTDSNDSSILSTSTWTTGKDFEFRIKYTKIVDYQLPNGTDVLSSATTSLSQTYLVELIDNGTTGIAYLNKSAGSSYSTGARKSLGILDIGSFNGTGTRSRYLNGYIGEIIIFDRALRTDERQSVENYIYKKWGIGS